MIISVTISCLTALASLIGLCYMYVYGVKKGNRLVKALKAKKKNYLYLYEEDGKTEISYHLNPRRICDWLPFFGGQKLYAQLESSTGFLLATILESSGNKTQYRPGDRRPVLLEILFRSVLNRSLKFDLCA